MIPRLFLALMVALLLVPATPPSPSSAADKPLRVVTSITPIADLVRNVGGERVDVTAIVPYGDEPEDYDPTPGDAATLSSARVFFANGLGLEAYLEDLIDSSGNGKLEVVTLSDGLSTLTGFGQGADVGGNPHMWLSIGNALSYIDVIQQTLARLDPNGAPFFEIRANQYKAVLSDLDAYILQQVRTIPEDQRVLVATHDATPYFAQRYGFRYLAIISANPDSDPSAQEYADLVKTVQDNQVKAVFGEAGFSDRFISQLAADTGATFVANLYTDTLSEGPPAASYYDMLKYDADTIVAALR